MTTAGAGESIRAMGATESPTSKSPASTSQTARRDASLRDATTVTRRGLGTRPIDLDAPISWGCSGRGWNCCVDKAIPVRPYDMVRLRHATGKSSQQLINERLVTFDWDGSGLLAGWLAQQPYERNRVACVFYEEVTNSVARRIRDTEPERFRSLPPGVQAAADAGGGDRRVAGLCNAHTGRPEACRGFPFQRDPMWRDHPEVAASQVFECGSCALAEPTTARTVMLDNDLVEFWRADEAYRAVALYLHSVGLANVSHPAYRRFDVDAAARTALWTALYVPDANPDVQAMGTPGAEQWRTPLDIEGDRRVLRLVFEAALDTADRLIETTGAERDALGGPEPTLPRPDLAPLLDGSRAVLPVLGG